MQSPRWATAAVLAACAGTPGNLEVAAGPLTFTFDDQPPGAAPHALVARDSGAPPAARWTIADGGADGSGRCAQVVATAHGETFHLLTTTAPRPADLSLSVQIHALGGAMDQGGGMVWRANGDDYYLARWNPLEDNVRIYRVVAGRRELLQNADVSADPATWHRLAVRAVGAHFTVSLDDREVLSVRDATLPGGGHAGLWSKADAHSLFDDLRIEPGPHGD